MKKGYHETTLYECKARNTTNQITKEDITEWLEIKVPIIRSCLIKMEQFRNTDLHFEYWTTGTFNESAITYLKHQKKKLNKFSIDWKDGKSVLDYAKSAKSKSMTNFLKEHFLNHPLNK